MASCVSRQDACVQRLWTTFLCLQASNQLSFAVQPAEEATLSLARRALEPVHLLHSKLYAFANEHFRRLKSRHPFVPAAQQLLKKVDNLNISATNWADYKWSMDWKKNCSRLHTFLPDAGPLAIGALLPRRAWIRLNRLRTGVGRFRSTMHRWGVASSAACE